MRRGRRSLYGVLATALFFVLLVSGCGGKKSASSATQTPSTPADLKEDFDFTRSPRPPLILDPYPSGTPTPTGS